MNSCQKDKALIHTYDRSKISKHKLIYPEEAFTNNLINTVGNLWRSVFWYSARTAISSHFKVFWREK